MPGAPTLGSIFSERLVVGVGDMAVSNRDNITLSTYALGSCVAVAAYDPMLYAGGLIHIMLPESKLSMQRARKHPAVFADSGIPPFVEGLLGMGVDRGRLRMFMGGGANVINRESDLFRIGERNIKAVRDQLERYGMRPHITSLGGFSNRTVHLELSSGKLTLKMPEGVKETVLA